MLCDVGVDEHSTSNNDFLLLWCWALAKPVGAERRGCGVGAVWRTDAQCEERMTHAEKQDLHAAAALLLTEGTVLIEADARQARQKRRRRTGARRFFHPPPRPAGGFFHALTRPCVRAALADAHGRRADVVLSDVRGDANGGMSGVSTSRHLPEA